MSYQLKEKKGPNYKGHKHTLDKNCFFQASRVVVFVGEKKKEENFPPCLKITTASIFRMKNDTQRESSHLTSTNKQAVVPLSFDAVSEAIHH